jgi:hypothetical protein
LERVALLPTKPISPLLLDEMQKSENMTNERIDLDLVNDYREKYVVFLDLLGFSALVNKVSGDVLERHRVVEALKLVRDTLTQDPKIDFRFTYFSDCIVLSAERSPQALWSMFQSIELLTFNLLQLCCLF